VVFQRNVFRALRASADRWPVSARVAAASLAIQPGDLALAARGSPQVPQAGMPVTRYRTGRPAEHRAGDVARSARQIFG